MKKDCEVEKRTLLSFVIPCYRSEKTIEKVIFEITDTVSRRDAYDYEIICVNDASPDAVYSILVKLATVNEKIKVINLAKNFGKHSAVLAGCAYANGEYIICADDDFQCPISELWKLLKPIEDNICDVATANYREKKQAYWKNIGSEINRIMSSAMLNKPRSLRFENFFVMKRFVVKEIIKYVYPYPYLEGLILRTTQRIATIEMDERERADGQKTGFTFCKSLSLWVNGFTAFSVKPLRISAVIGVVTAFMGFLLCIYMILKKLKNPDVLAGYTSLIAVQLFASGLIMMILGMLGEYVGRIYICLNNSPQYVIRNTVNIDQICNDDERKV